MNPPRGPGIISTPCLLLLHTWSLHLPDCKLALQGHVYTVFDVLFLFSFEQINAPFGFVFQLARTIHAASAFYN